MEEGRTGIDYADLALDSTGDVGIPIRIIRGTPAVAQRVRVRFKWFLGEWHLDKRKGVPYYQKVLVKNPDPIILSTIFRRVLLFTPGVARVHRLVMTLDPETRTLYPVFEAVLTNGTPLTEADGVPPFILTDIGGPDA